MHLVLMMMPNKKVLLNIILSPLIGAGVVAFALILFKVNAPMSFLEKSVEIGSALASISTTLLGLLLAAFAILASISEDSLLRKMKEYGQYDNLLITLLFNIALLLVVVIFGCFLLLGAKPSDSIFYTTVAFLSAVLCSFLQIVYKFSVVLYYLSKPKLKLKTKPATKKRKVIEASQDSESD